MKFSEDQIDELKKIAPNLSIAEEGSYIYFLIHGLKMPNGCSPEVVDALLCPVARDGYESTLFFPCKITGCPNRNWNRQNVRIVDKNWFAISWKVNPGLRLREMLLIHLSAFNNEKK